MRGGEAKSSLEGLPLETTFTPNVQQLVDGNFSKISYNKNMSCTLC